MGFILIFIQNLHRIKDLSSHPEIFDVLSKESINDTFLMELESFTLLFLKQWS